MYCRMLDAMLSKGQEDENGILFVCFPVTAIAAVLSCSSMTVKRSLNELETAGLIMRVRHTNKDGQKVYTTDVVVEENEFAESKRSDDNAPASSAPASMPEGNGFMNIPDGIDEELPFN